MQRRVSHIFRTENEDVPEISAAASSAAPLKALPAKKSKWDDEDQDDDVKVRLFPTLLLPIMELNGIFTMQTGIVGRVR